MSVSISNLIEQRTLIVDEYESGVCRRAPHQLKGNTRFELQVCHVSRWLSVTAYHTCRPRPSGPEIWETSDLNTASKAITEVDPVHLTAILVVRSFAEHCSQIAVVVIVEAMSGVALPRTSTGVL